MSFATDKRNLDYVARLYSGTVENPSIRETILSMALKRGLHIDQASEILDMLLADDAKHENILYNVIDDAIGGYPAGIIDTFFELYKDHAITWFDLHCPEHFARRMFK